MKNLAFLSAFALTAMLSAPAVAQWAPDRPVTLILANNAGGGADFIGRLIAEKASEIWGQPVVVENQGGAAGRIGTQAAIRAANDGYTFFMGQNTLAVWPAIYTNMPFDTFEELDAITQITEIPMIFVAHPSVEATDLVDFADYVGERPGELNYSSGGPGSISHLVFSLYQALTDTQLVTIPYPGTAETVGALLSGEVHATYVAPTLVQEAVSTGDLKALAVAASERLAFLSDVPTVEELGWPELNAVGWNGIFLPADASEEIRQAYFDVFHEVMADPAVAEAVANQGQIVKVSTDPADFQSYIDSQVELYVSMGEAAGIEKQDAQR